MARAQRSRSLEEELKAQPQYKEALEDAANRVRKLAVGFERAAHAPWMPPRENPGRTIVVLNKGGVSVNNLDHGGHLVEWGSKNNPPHAPLRRAVLAAGLKFRPVPPQRN